MIEPNLFPTAVEKHLAEAEKLKQTKRVGSVGRQQKEQPDVERRANEARAEEYRRAGLEPPEPKHGMIVSLSMMLVMGWRIEQDQDGGKVLVSPRR